MTDNLAAFTLKEAVKDDFAGGSFAYRDGDTFNLKEALDANDGVIVVADPQLKTALGEVEVLKSTSVPDNPTVVGPGAEEYVAPSEPRRSTPPTPPTTSQTSNDERKGA